MLKPEKEYEITAFIKVREGESGYRIIEFSFKVFGSKLLSLNQLFELFVKKAKDAGEQVEHVINLRIVELVDLHEVSDPPVDKNPKKPLI